jgi:hypothetical protein
MAEKMVMGCDCGNFKGRCGGPPQEGNPSANSKTPLTPALSPRYGSTALAAGEGEGAKNAVPSTYKTSSSRAARIGFCLLIGVLALAAVGKVVQSDTLDPDAFWHMRVGQELLNRGWPGPLVDDLSFASRHDPWTPYSWLAEMGMKKLWDAGGIRAAVAAQAAMEGAFVVLLALGAVNASRGSGGSVTGGPPPSPSPSVGFRRMGKREMSGESDSGRPRYIPSALATAAGGILSLAYLSFRPVTAALVLLAAIAWLIFRDRRMSGRSRAIWLVPALTALLINVHFFALMVPLWTGAFLLGDWLSSYHSSPHPAETNGGGGLGWGRSLNRGVLLLVLSIFACGLTPMLPGMLRSVFDYSTHDVMVKSGHIEEMRPFYEGIMGHVSAAIVAVVGACLIAACVKQRRDRGAARVGLGEIICVAGSAILLFRLGRMAPVFAIIGMPLFAATMPGISHRVLTRKPVLAMLAICIAMMAVSITRAFPARGQSADAWLNRLGPDFPGYPCAAAAFIDSHATAARGRLICEFTWGGYLEWRLNPRFQTLMDGRTQLFSADFWRSTVLGSKDIQKAFLAATSANVACISAKKSSYGDLLAALGWKTVYQDGYARVMIPTNSDAQASAR